MKLMDRIANRFGYISKERMREFAAGRSTRLTGDWPTYPTHIDQDLRKDLRIVRARARDLVLNNTYGSSFVHVLRRNVTGSNGLQLQMAVHDPNGSMDTSANKIIESAWLNWGKFKNCTVTRKLSWIDIQNVCISSLVSDGEIIFRKYQGFNNSHRFAIQYIDPELLDINFSQTREGGKNEIRMGVELDEYEAPVAYHFLQWNPSVSVVYNSAYYSGQDHIRIPASEILHIYPLYQAGQTRGFPFMVPAMIALKMLGAYEEAEVIASRAAASKMGFLETPTQEGYTGKKNDDGSKEMRFEPLTIEELPAGSKFTPWDPQHPNAAFGPFIKAVKQSIASGLGISYPMLSGDLESINFSSIRAGLLEDREEFKYLQKLLIEHLAEPVFEAWLMSAMTSGSLPLPLAKYEKFNSPRFIGRRWPWVDPKNDAEAYQIQIDQKLKSRTAVMAEQGDDIEDVLTEIAEEEKLAKEKGVKFPDPGDGDLTVTAGKGKGKQGGTDGAGKNPNPTI